MTIQATWPIIGKQGRRTIRGVVDRCGHREQLQGQLGEKVPRSRPQARVQARCLLVSQTTPLQARQRVLLAGGPFVTRSTHGNVTRPSQILGVAGLARSPPLCSDSLPAWLGGSGLRPTSCGAGEWWWRRPSGVRPLVSPDGNRASWMPYSSIPLLMRWTRRSRSCCQRAWVVRGCSGPVGSAVVGVDAVGGPPQGDLTDESGAQRSA